MRSTIIFKGVHCDEVIGDHKVTNYHASWTPTQAITTGDRETPPKPHLSRSKTTPTLSLKSLKHRFRRIFPSSGSATNCRGSTDHLAVDHYTDDAATDSEVVQRLEVPGRRRCYYDSESPGRYDSTASGSSVSSARGSVASSSGCGGGGDAEGGGCRFSLSSEPDTDDEDDGGVKVGGVVEHFAKVTARAAVSPLRRSQSAGCRKDIPAHALFLRYDNKSSKDLHTKRDSMGESSSSGSDELDEIHSPSCHSNSKINGSKSKKKSLAKDVKDKLSFLRRRHTDTALSSRDKIKPATPMDVLQWSRSFENLLHDKQGLELFRIFLRTEFSEENIEFWISCERFRDVVGAHKQLEEAQRIYTDFVAVQSPHEINLDSSTRQSTMESLGRPDRLMFEEAQRRIQALMEKDSYRRFLRSSQFLDLLGNLRSQFSPP